jgi:hypothetical protein
MVSDVAHAHVSSLHSKTESPGGVAMIPAISNSYGEWSVTLAIGAFGPWRESGDVPKLSRSARHASNS